MQRWSIVRVVGLLTALVLIIFGGVDNVWRTMKFASERFFRN